MEADCGEEALRDFPHQTLERKLPYLELSRLLVALDLPEGHSPGPEPKIRFELKYLDVGFK